MPIEACGRFYLYVYSKNIPAIKFYERAGFVELHKPYIDKSTGRDHKRMVLVLEEAADKAEGRAAGDAG